MGLIWRQPPAVSTQAANVLDDGEAKTLSYPPRVLDHLHILLSKLVGVELEEPLRYLRQRREFGLLVDVLLAIFILKEALLKRMKKVFVFSRIFTVNLR